jgi:hypothetical protein
VPGGRLTFQSGVPVTTTDRYTTNAQTLYYTPYLHDMVWLSDGTRWIAKQFTEVSLALSGLTASTPYDVFLYLSSGVPTLTTVAWPNSTTSSSTTIQDGRECMASDKTRLFLGSFQAVAANQGIDSLQNRSLWNKYNRVLRSARMAEGAGHTYGGNVIQQWKGGLGDMRVQVMIGRLEDAVGVSLTADFNCVSSSVPQVGWAWDSTSTFTTSVIQYEGSNNMVRISRSITSYQFAPNPGPRNIYVNEVSSASITNTFNVAILDVLFPG